MWLKKLDPDWKFAQRHGQANRIGIPQDPRIRQDSGIMCRCCHNIIEKQPIPICGNTKQLEFLGFGVPLYYSFLRNCIILLILSSLCYHVISLYWAITHNQIFCQQYPAQSTGRLLASQQGANPRCWTFMVRFARLQKQITPQQQIMRIVNWLIQFLFLLYTRNKIIKKAEYHDQRQTTLTDFSIIIKGIQPQKMIKQKLKIFFQTFFEEKYEIKQITLLPSYPEIQQLKKQNKKIRKQLRFHYKKQIFNQQFQELLKFQQNINQQIYQKAQQQFRLSNQDKLECEKAIVIFNTEIIKDSILQNFRQLQKHKKKQLSDIFGDNSHKIHLQQSPSPIEIIWNHINQNQRKRVIRSIISWTLSACILVIMTVAIYYILHAKTNLIISSLNKDQNTQSSHQINGAIALVFIAIIFTLFFNKLVMSKIFHLLTEFQLLQTGFKFQRSFGIKYCLGLFFTTAVMTLIVEGIESQNFHTYLYGLIDEQTLMFFATITFIPIFWLINPFQLFRVIMRRRKQGARDLTQKQANKIMQDSSYEIGKRYAQIVQIVWFTYLYSTLIPLGAILAVISLSLFYWIDKLNLLRRSVLKINLSSKLIKTFLSMLQLTLVIAPIGQLIFDGIYRDSLKTLNLVPSIVMVSLGMIYSFLPKQRLIKRLYPQKFNPSSKFYEQIADKFLLNYHTQHPILQIINEQKYERNFIKKGYNLTEIPKQSERILIET